MRCAGWRPTRCAAPRLTNPQIPPRRANGRPLRLHRRHRHRAVRLCPPGARAERVPVTPCGKAPATRASAPRSPRLRAGPAARMPVRPSRARHAICAATSRRRCVRSRDYRPLCATCARTIRASIIQGRWTTGPRRCGPAVCIRGPACATWSRMPANSAARPARRGAASRSRTRADRRLTATMNLPRKRRAISRATSPACGSRRATSRRRKGAAFRSRLRLRSVSASSRSAPPYGARRVRCRCIVR